MFPIPVFKVLSDQKQPSQMVCIQFKLVTVTLGTFTLVFPFFCLTVQVNYWPYQILGFTSHLLFIYLFYLFIYTTTSNVRLQHYIQIEIKFIVP